MNPLHYPSLELCKKLTEERFPNTKHFISHLGKTSLHSGQWVYPSVMELLDKLPIEFSNDGGNYGLVIRHMNNNKYYVAYENYNEEAYNAYMVCINKKELGNALAEIWLWLKENDLLSKK